MALLVYLVWATIGHIGAYGSEFGVRFSDGTYPVSTNHRPAFQGPIPKQDSFFQTHICTRPYTIPNQDSFFQIHMYPTLYHPKSGLLCSDLLLRSGISAGYWGAFACCVKVQMNACKLSFQLAFSWTADIFHFKCCHSGYTER